MKPEVDQFTELIDWGKDSENVRAMLMTGSRAEPNSFTDSLSDYDIELYVKDTAPFLKDDWMEFLGNIMIRWPLEPASTFSEHWITRLVIFTNGSRFDFQITGLQNPDHSTLRHGFKIILDKDNLFSCLAADPIRDKPVSVPDEKKFLDLVNAYFWDATYVAKCLRRNELFYAKYMLDSNLRFSKLQVILEWHINMINDIPVNTNKYGRFFRKYLSQELWSRVENTFAGAGIDDNWNALFNMTDLFRKLAVEISLHYGFSYPEATDRAVTAYCKKIQSTGL